MKLPIQSLGTEPAKPLLRWLNSAERTRVLLSCNTDSTLILRKLGSYSQQNGLAVALRELDRIECTLFILDWLQSVELRRL